MSDIEYTLNDLIPLPDVLYILGFAHNASLIGKEPSRPAQLYNLTRVAVNHSNVENGAGRLLVGFPIAQIRALALLFDMWSVGIEDQPSQSDERYLAYISVLAAPEKQIAEVSNELFAFPSDDLCIKRFREVMKKMPNYPYVPVDELLTRKQLAEMEGVSHQTVYNRAKDGKYKSVPWQGYKLWLTPTQMPV